MGKRREDRPMVGMYELLEAVEAAIKSAAPAERDALAKTLEHYCEDFPEEFFWATGAQAPTLLNHLMMAVTPNCLERAKHIRTSISGMVGNA